MRSYIVKLAASRKEDHPSFSHDAAKYFVASAAGGGIPGPFLMRRFGETDEELTNSKLKGLGYGLAGALAVGVPVLHLTKNKPARALAGATGVGLGNAYLNKKIREERARKGRK